MRLLISLYLIFCLGSSVEGAESAVDVKPLPFPEFMQLLAERDIELSKAQAKELQRFLTDSKAAELAQQIEEDKSVSLRALLPHIVNRDGSQPVLASLQKHPDVLLRFIVNCGLAGSGDSDAAQVLLNLLHDERLEMVDKRAIKTWAKGAGIDPAKDDAKTITAQMMTLMGQEQKLKAGDGCPEFSATTDADIVLEFKQLKGKVIVFHFWSSSCGPCLARMKQHIEKLSQLPQDETVIVFVSLDEDEKIYQATVKKYGMPFHNVCDKSGWGGPLARTFGVKQLPFDVIIDANGKVFSNSIEELPELE